MPKLCPEARTGKTKVASCQIFAKRMWNRLEKYQAELSRATSRISSLGIALGYGAGICLLIVALIPVTMLHGSTFALRLAIGLSGIWWAVFTVPAALWLPSVSSYSHPALRRSERGNVQDDLDDKTIPKWQEGPFRGATLRRITARRFPGSGSGNIDL